MATRKSAPAPERARTGRPPKYRDEFVEQARKFCLLGATNEELARLFEVGLATLNRWIAETPAFRDAIKDGRAIADGEVANRLFRRACGYSHQAQKIMQYEGVPVIVDYIEHYPPDATSMIFWLKNRRPDLWREKPQTGENDDAPPPVSITVNVRDARLRDDDKPEPERPAG